MGETPARGPGSLRVNGTGASRRASGFGVLASAIEASEGGEKSRNRGFRPCSTGRAVVDHPFVTHAGSQKWTDHRLAGSSQIILMGTSTMPAVETPPR